MTSKHFCLKWTKFQSNILSAFESLQATEDLADVTLTCEGINLRAHKFVLSACSPYFRTIFKENPCSHPIVILKDVCHSDLIAIVNFMYQGEVTVSEEQLSSFFHTATILQVSALMTTTGALHKKPPPVVQSRKSKGINTESPPECAASKKLKVLAKRKDEETPPRMEEGESCESLEVSRIKTEVVEEEPVADLGNNNDIDMSENVEVIVNEKSSILEAALEIRDKPSSILERSLTSAGKSPNTFQPSAPVPDPKILANPILIPRKPPDEKLPQLEPPLYPVFEYPTAEFLRQRIKSEHSEHSDSLEVMSPEELNFQIRNVELQPHHSSQCGNCPHCGKVYSNQSALKYHVRLVHSDLTNMYCCHLCPESFDYREGYKKHMAEVHLIRN